MNASQEKVLRELLRADQPFPEVAPDLRGRVAAFLDDELEAIIDRIQGELVITKSTLTVVHQCEGLFESREEMEFEWSLELVAGVLTHLAIQHQHQDQYVSNPAHYVQTAFQVATADGSVADWLARAPESHLIEVKRRTATQLEIWTDTWPRLPPTWRVRGEPSYSARAGQRKVVLVARPDLVIGPTPRLTHARQAVIDLKTSVTLHSESREEAWFYALVILLRVGSPPHSSIIYSIPSGEWHPEPQITEETLFAAARRVVGGVRKVTELAMGRKPELTPNIDTYCRWCPVRPDCPAYGAASLKRGINGDSYADGSPPGG